MNKPVHEVPSLYEYRRGITPKPIDVIEFEDCTTVVHEISGLEAKNLLAEYKLSMQDSQGNSSA